MRLAVFFPASLFSAWCCSYGLVDTLKRMGHEVTSVPIDPQSVLPIVQREIGPFDGAVISGPEHLLRYSHVFERYGISRIPIVAWMHETVEREDYGKLDVDALKRSADIVFCPGKQDEKYGFRYLPFGVDTEIFNPRPFSFERGVAEHLGYKVNLASRSIDAAFIGLLYPKRQAFLKELKAQGINLIIGNVQVLELGGIHPRKTAELYADNLRKIKVFVNLPTLSQLAVTKIYEALACGTPVLTPKIEHMENLEHLPVCVYKDAAECAELIRRTVPTQTSAPTLLPAFVAEHSLELRCQVMIDALKEIGAKAA